MADRVKPSEELRQRSLPPKEQRNLRPSETVALSVVRNHRRWLTRDIDRLLTKSFDPSLSKDELVVVNDQINEKMRRKAEWERRLVELGGVLEDVDGGGGYVGGYSGGYHYFGRAKELLANQDTTEGGEDHPHKRRQGLLYHMVNAEYYGFHHNHDTKLLQSTTVNPVPTIEQVEAAILRAKKAALLARL